MVFSAILTLPKSASTYFIVYADMALTRRNAPKHRSDSSSCCTCVWLKLSRPETSRFQLWPAKLGNNPIPGFPRCFVNLPALLWSRTIKSFWSTRSAHSCQVHVSSSGRWTTRWLYSQKLPWHIGLKHLNLKHSNNTFWMLASTTGLSSTKTVLQIFPELS
jgi:hypothetical protein